MHTTCSHSHGYPRPVGDRNWGESQVKILIRQCDNLCSGSKGGISTERRKNLDKEDESS